MDQAAAIQQSNRCRAPLMLQFLTLIPYTKQAQFDDQSLNDMIFSPELMINILPNGKPAYKAHFKTPPTACTTPGKMLPGGFTKSGKWKPARWTPVKMDKRAGK